MSLSPETRLQRAPQVVARLVDDTLALLDADSGAYFSVNEIGALFMDMSEQAASLAEIAERVAAEYEVSREEALADLTELAEDLVREGLVQVRTDEE